MEIWEILKKLLLGRRSGFSHLGMEIQGPARERKMGRQGSIGKEVLTFIGRSWKTWRKVENSGLRPI